MRIIKVYSILASFLFLGFMMSCSNNDDFNGMNVETNLIETDNIQNEDLTEADTDALLFMLEEEKLARDTYKFLNDLWNINLFSNIGNSEQSHMDAIINLLDANMIDYSILPDGEFFDTELQALFDQFEIEGSLSTENALHIGATIEDLDIVDLQEYIDATSNTDLKDVFGSLQCGSRNHLRSFVNSIENNGNYYVPQFLTQEEYNLIISSNHEQCNQ